MMNTEDTNVPFGQAVGVKRIRSLGGVAMFGPKKFRKLSRSEKLSFRYWARKNYVLFTPIDGRWHPVIQSECIRMNEE